MNRLSEITDLFARLASNLQTLDPKGGNEDQACDLSIAKLNQSLNLNENSRVRVLDTALSLMCFKAPQVFDSVIEYLVKTIVSVLSSSITCKVLRFQKEEVLRIGSVIPSHDCTELIEVCADVLGKLGGHGMLSHPLLCAVVKVAVSASHFRYVVQSTPIFEVKSTDWRITNVSKLLSHLPKEISFKSQEIPLRLLLWYLDPLILKEDVSQILQDAIRRPFLCLNVAFYERMDWRCILTCLVLSPAMFIETRALLHNWFLMTGLASVLELQIELVSLVLDVISRPMWWGIPMEVGSKLPFSQSYFPQKHHLLRTLAGPLSCDNFLRLVHSTSKTVSHARRHSDSTLKQAAIKAARIDHKSMWAMAMNFPDWFFFASPRSSAAAARYIAWILSPISESHQDLIVNCLTKISESWTLRQISSDNHYKGTAGYNKLKKPKFHDNKECHTVLKEYDCSYIQLWLKEFQDIYTMNWKITVNSSACCDAKSSSGISLHQNVLFRRIPLGILIGCSGGIKEDGCELLLHYAATGIIPPLAETRTAGLKDRRWGSRAQEDSITWTEKCNIKEAVAGACLVFRLTDVIEIMSVSLFENEESGVEFICRVKLRARKYLLSCMKKLLHFEIDEDGGGLLMLRDLCSRLIRWRHQGRDVFQDSMDLNDAIEALSHKLSSS
ncbi:hypothetical protein F0562_009667 [Nyssa sinensis]|uniref:Uncharacterized protein n=1 Tax=Nyssa sinensis TaxID=561372 RepID=A0A5J4ZZ82_9ASTE|nr:hypothetical protein F0562_009667 [Nyssa sinensis]